MLQFQPLRHFDRGLGQRKSTMPKEVMEHQISDQYVPYVCGTEQFNGTRVSVGPFLPHFPKVSDCFKYLLDIGGALCGCGLDDHVSRPERIG